MTELQRDFMTNKLTHLEPILSQSHLNRVLSVIYNNVVDKNKQYGITLFKSTLNGLNDSGFSEKMPSNYRFSTDFVDSNIMSGNSFVVAYKWILDDNLDLHFKYVTYNNSDVKMFNTTFISSINEEKANRIVGLLALNQKNIGDDEEMALTIEEIKAELQTAMNEIKANDNTNKAEVLSKLLDVEVAIDNIDVSGLATKEDLANIPVVDLSTVATKTDIASIVASIPGASVSDWTEKFTVALRDWMDTESQMFMRYDKTNKVFEWTGIVHYNQNNFTGEQSQEFGQGFKIEIPAELQEFVTSNVYIVNYKQWGQSMSAIMGISNNTLMSYTDSTPNGFDVSIGQQFYIGNALLGPVALYDAATSTQTCALLYEFKESNITI